MSACVTSTRRSMWLRAWIKIQPGTVCSFGGVSTTLPSNIPSAAKPEGGTSMSAAIISQRTTMRGLMPGSGATLCTLVVILQAEVSDQRLAFQVAQGVLQLHQLDEQIVLGIQSRRSHGRLQIEAQPFLDAESLEFPAALGQVEEQHQVQHDGRGQDRIATEKVDLDLHRIAQPAEDVNVVPTLFVITTRRVIVNADLVMNLF